MSVGQLAENVRCTRRIAAAMSKEQGAQDKAAPATAAMKPQVLQAKIQTSVSLTRNLISSWLGPEEPHGKNANNEADQETQLKARPPRLGLGATASQLASKTTHMPVSMNAKLNSLPPALKKKIERQMQKRKEAETKSARSTSSSGNADPGDDSEDDDDEDSMTSKASVLSKKRSKANISSFDMYKNSKKRR
ncbi:fungal family protein [Schizosaccharomyces japonicus yFS275]|uniref:Fungal family protein n=1 Tax=Schizosaccharomyces japonicus (strain yFS275 / FY16936) TaxID=402676 RepID=B6JW48_SCHJY|nr:fungal family protein [Schizosaccharomyces japonicus yFS275]EEB05599.2 fungal family protein [Schizosaccharomyces japonicus yFS275]